MSYKEANVLINRYGRPSKVALELENMRHELADMRSDLRKIAELDARLNIVLDMMKSELRKIEDIVGLMEFNDGRRQ